MRQPVSVAMSLLLVWGLLSSQSALALKVDSDASYIRFVSVKKGSVAEIGHFGRFEGEVSDSGALALSIELASVDTAIAIRDQRMRDELFEVAEFPRATVEGKVDLAATEALGAGQEMTLPVQATLSLHGVAQVVEATVSAVRLADGALKVATIDPILLSTDQLDLTAGVQKLQALAGLPSINWVVPVYFSLVLR